MAFTTGLVTLVSSTPGRYGPRFEIVLKPEGDYFGTVLYTFNDWLASWIDRTKEGSAFTAEWEDSPHGKRLLKIWRLAEAQAS